MLDVVLLSVWSAGAHEPCPLSFDVIEPAAGVVASGRCKSATQRRGGVGMGAKGAISFGGECECG